MSTAYIAASLTVLAFIQNVAFSIMSRSRNRNHTQFHIIAAIFSNGIWFLTFRELVIRDMGLALFPWYCIGTVAGSLCGVKISMFIERLIGAESDGHLKKGPVDPEQFKEFKRRLDILWDKHPQGFFHTEAGN